MTTAGLTDALLVENFAAMPVTAHGAHYLAVSISTTLNQEIAQRASRSHYQSREPGNLPCLVSMVAHSPMACHIIESP
jgi:hypothetical protein